MLRSHVASRRLPLVRRRALAGLSAAALVATAFASTNVDPTIAAVPTAPGPDITIGGSGWGHSVGMSQYGAYVMALQGFTSQQILQHYYSGTAVQADPRTDDDAVVRTNLFVDKAGVDGSLRVDLTAQGARSTTAPPTSGVSLHFDDGQPDRDLPTNGSWWISHDPNNDQYVLHSGDGELSRAPDTSPVVVTPHPAGDNPGVLKVLNLADTVTDPTNAASVRRWIGTFAWGSLEITSPASSGVMNPVIVQPLRNYLYGIDEVPASWPTAAVQAQVIAARTYTGPFLGAPKATGQWSLGATPKYQNYVGYYKERADSGAKWVAAVDATTDQAITYQGALAKAYYSSSHGLGRSENSEDSWAYGSVVPYLRSVADPYSVAVNPATGKPYNPYASWTAVTSNAGLAGAMGLARVSNVTVLSRTTGGSPKVLAVNGWTTDGQRVACQWSGGKACPANDTRGKGAGAVLRISLPLTQGGSGGRLRSQQISAFSIAPFNDDDQSVHQFAIAALAAAGVTKGCDATNSALFCPGASVTRGQMAAFIVAATKLPLDPSAPDPFSDIADSTFRTQITALAKAGRISGFTDGTFRPQQPVDRARMASFLVRGFGLTPDPAAPDGFTDIAGTEPHRANINAIAAAGITSGCTATTYCPSEVVTRGQMASFLAAAMGLV